MAGPEHAPEVLDTFPAWAHAALNIGVFVGAIIVSAFTFVKHLKSFIPPFGDEHPDDVASHMSISSEHSLVSSLERMATATEGLLRIEQNRVAEAAIEKEVARRVKEH